VRRLNRSQRGQALVEFSLVVIVLMAIVLGIIEGSRAVWNYNTLSNSVREGTRYAIVHGGASPQPVGPAANDAAVRSKVLEFDGGLDNAELAVTSSWLDGNNNKGSRVRVTATYEYDTVFSGLLGIPPITMTSTSTMDITN
jgi:Flp pilus assembly protein TadG